MQRKFVLAAALDIAGLERVVVLSAGTDGSDGPTDAAGALADGQTLRRNPDARRQAVTNLGELTELGESLRAAMLRQALKTYTGG